MASSRQKKYKPVFFSIGMNRKLAKNVAVFNLPARFTCSPSKVCSELCYAEKAQRCYPSAAKKRDENYGRITQANSAAEMAKLLIDDLTGITNGDSSIKYVRIHESGDFFNQQYVEAICLLAAAFPNIKFLAFTRQTDWDFSAAPENLKLWNSRDCSMDGRKRIEGKPDAYLCLKAEAPPEGHVACPTIKEMGVHHYCGAKCTHCWEQVTPVYFKQH